MLLPMTVISKLLRGFAYLWAAPTTALGLLLLLPALLTGGGVQVVRGVVEIHGGIVAWLLRKATPLEGGALALTLGHVVLGLNRNALDISREHERIHVRQCERWGPFFIPAYFGGCLLAHLRGGRAYRDNPFEREAYENS